MTFFPAISLTFLPYCAFSAELSLSLAHLPFAHPHTTRHFTWHLFFASSACRCERREPTLPPSLIRLSLANNLLGGPLEYSFINAIRLLPITNLDLSNNALLCPSYEMDWLLRSNLTFLNLASNQFDCEFAIKIAIRGPYANILGLDLHNNSFSGDLLGAPFPKLVFLDLSQNNFKGDYQSISNFPSLTQMNISNNKFSFDVSALSSAPFLSSLDASSNLIHGIFAPSGWPNMLIADLRNNSFQEQPRLSAIGSLFVDFKLQVLNLDENQGILPFDKLELNASGLQRLPQSSPSKTFTGGVCYQLGFPDQPTGSTFSFDEGLFRYAQCDCDPTHFGLPPSKCFACPSSASVSECGDRQLTIPEGRFSLLAPNVNSSSTRFLPTSLIQDPDNSHIESESCIYNTFQALTLRTNCRGLKISAAIFAANESVTLSDILATQCREGSQGRLCSRCKCDPSGAGECWFSKGATCKRCSFTMPHGRSIALVIGIFVAIEVGLSTTMFLVLRSKRTPKVARYAQAFCPTSLPGLVTALSTAFISKNLTNFSLFDPIRCRPTLKTKAPIFSSDASTVYTT